MKNYSQYPRPGNNLYVYLGWMDKENMAQEYKGMNIIVLKRKEIVLFLTTWMNLEDIINEISQT